MSMAQQQKQNKQQNNNNNNNNNKNKYNFKKNVHNKEHNFSIHTKGLGAS